MKFVDAEAKGSQTRSVWHRTYIGSIHPRAFDDLLSKISRGFRSLLHRKVDAESVPIHVRRCLPLRVSQLSFETMRDDEPSRRWAESPQSVTSRRNGSIRAELHSDDYSFVYHDQVRG